MDKVKYTLSGSVANATFTFDDERVPALTVNLNDMSINDGDILAKQLNDYGQEYKANCIARIPSQAVAGGQGMEFALLPLPWQRPPSSYWSRRELAWLTR